MNRAALAHLLLRFGVAFAFLFPPIAALFDPVSWEGYFPHFVHTLPINILYLLHGFGLLEAILALWILSGKNIRIPAMLAALILLAIVGFDFSDITILFRDISILAMALALAAWPKAVTV